MSRILVVGSTGLLGRSAFQALQRRGHDALGASRHLEPSPKLHRLDLKNFEDVRVMLAKLEPDVVIQVTGGKAADPYQLIEANVVPTLSLLMAAASLKTPPSLIVTGSAAEYGEPAKMEPISESTKLNPVSGYGWAKVAETTSAIAFSQSEGLALTVVRPFNLVSSRLPDTTALGNLRNQLQNGSGAVRDIRCGRIDIVRDYVTTDFVGQALAELATQGAHGVVNICSGIGIRLEDLMRASGRVLGAEVRFRIAPDLAALPAPHSIVGDPSRLYSKIEARANADTDSLACVLMGSIE